MENNEFDKLLEEEKKIEKEYDELLSLSNEEFCKPEITKKLNELNKKMLELAKKILKKE